MKKIENELYNKLETRSFIIKALFKFTLPELRTIKNEVDNILKMREIL